MKGFTKIMLLLAVIFISGNMLNAADNLKIVILPFDKLNKEKNDELDTLIVGISETLSGALSTVNNFIIVDSNRVKRHLIENAEFKQAIGVETKDIENLRDLTKDKLEGDFIIYGSFNKIGNNIQLSAKFMNVKSGVVTQGVNVSGKYPDEIFILQEQLARDLTNKITGNLGLKQQNQIEDYSRSTGNYTAYQYYIKGRVEHLKYDIKNYPLAIDNYKKALKYDPKYALALAGLAEASALWGHQVAYAMGDPSSYYKTALEESKKAVEYGDNLYQTYRGLSMAYLIHQDYNNAQKIIDKAYKLNQNDAEILYVMAQLKNYDGKNMGKKGTESYNYIMRSLSLNPELIIAKWELAHSYSSIGEKDLALNEYKEIVNINPIHAPTLHNIALIYYDLQDYNNVEFYAAKAVSADSKTPQHHYTLGLAYFEKKEWNKAIASFENAVKLYPKYENALLDIAACYWYLEKWDMAYKYYNRIIEVNPNNKEVIQWRDAAYGKMNKK